MRDAFIGVHAACRAVFVGYNHFLADGTDRFDVVERKAMEPYRTLAHAGRVVFAEGGNVRAFVRRKRALRRRYSGPHGARQRAVQVVENGFELVAEVGPVGGVDVRYVGEPVHERAAELDASGGYRNAYGATARAVEIDKLRAFDEHPFADRQNHAMFHATVARRLQFGHVRDHHAVVEHRRVVGKSRRSTICDELGLEPGQAVVVRQHVGELNRAAQDPFGGLVGVPDRERFEHGRRVVCTVAGASFRRVVFRKDPQAEPAHRMGGIVLERRQRYLAQTHARRVRRPFRVCVQAIPKAEMRAAGRGIVLDDVVRMRDPEGGRCDVVIQQTSGRYYLYGQVVLNHVIGLDAVFQEDGATHHVKDDVMLDEDFMRAVNVDGAVERAVDGAAEHVRAGHAAVQVEVDGISAQTERLAGVRHLHVLDVRRNSARVQARGV